MPIVHRDCAEVVAQCEQIVPVHLAEPAQNLQIAARVVHLDREAPLDRGDILRHQPRPVGVRDERLPAIIAQHIHQLLRAGALRRRHLPALPHVQADHVEVRSLPRSSTSHLHPAQ